MIYIDDRQKKIEVTEELKNNIENIINHALKKEEVHIENEISLIFVDNQGIKEINLETRGIDKVTDVLSFPMLDYPSGKIYKEVYKEEKFDDSYFSEGRLVLGDIALSLERAEEQRIDYGHSFTREVCYLIVHSILHLLGYDHMEEEEKSLMRMREEEILSDFKITR